MVSRRTTITSTPPPECSVCRDPMRRPDWALRGGVCSGCSTTPEGMAALERARKLRAAATPTTITVQQRIERLAAKRAARAQENP